MDQTVCSYMCLFEPLHTLIFMCYDVYFFFAFSRAGLAGLRVGYGAFPLSIIEYLWRAKQPYNVSVAAEVSACAALQNPDYLEVLVSWDFLV